MIEQIDLLAHIRAGGKVVEHTSYGDRPVTVDHVTKTQIIDTQGGKYRISDGRKLGQGNWTFTCLLALTPEREAALARKKQQQADLGLLLNTTWHDVPTEKVARIAAILREQAE